VAGAIAVVTGIAIGARREPQLSRYQHDGLPFGPVQSRQPPKIRSINRGGVQPLHHLGGQRHVSATAAQKRPRLRAKLVGFHRADRRPPGLGLLG
jgi:hypothetical protein